MFYYPYFQTYGETSLDTEGSFSNNPKIWWHIQFPDWVRALTLLHLQILIRVEKDNKLIVISVLEFFVEITNYAAMAVYLQSYPHLKNYSYPTLLNWTDNTSALSWIRKASLKFLILKPLHRVFCVWIIINPLGLSRHQIANSENGTTDAIFHMFLDSNTLPYLNTLLPAVPNFRSYRHFNPSAEFLLYLFSAMSLEQKQGLPQINNLGHFSPGRRISQSFS